MLTFLFRAEVPASRQDALVAEIGAWPEVERVRQINPRVCDPLQQRLCFLIPRDDRQHDELLGRLQLLAEVEAAEAPAARWRL